MTRTEGGLLVGQVFAGTRAYVPAELWSFFSLVSWSLTSGSVGAKPVVLPNQSAGLMDAVISGWFAPAPLGATMQISCSCMVTIQRYVPAILV